MVMDVWRAGRSLPMESSQRPLSYWWTFPIWGIIRPIARIRGITKCASMCLWICGSMYVCVCLCVFVCGCIYLCLFVSVCVCLCLFVSVCMCKFRRRVSLTYSEEKFVSLTTTWPVSPPSPSLLLFFSLSLIIALSLFSQLFLFLSRTFQRATLRILRSQKTHSWMASSVQAMWER